jgi:hypothetical protein
MNLPACQTSRTHGFGPESLPNSTAKDRAEAVRVAITCCSRAQQGKRLIDVQVLRIPSDYSACIVGLFDQLVAGVGVDAGAQTGCQNELVSGRTYGEREKPGKDACAEVGYSVAGL